MPYGTKEEALASIKRNIERHGHHVYVVSQGSVPRFAYTIGLRETVGAELVLAGAIIYDVDQVLRIIDVVAADLRKRMRASTSVFRLGKFALRNADASWTRRLLLGALDYYKMADAEALQLVPDEKHLTLDVPDMRTPWEADRVWRWLDEEWNLPVPKDAECMTMLDVLRGEAVVEVARWEDNYWEMFASDDDRSEKNARLVPIGVMVGADPTLEPALRLKVEDAILRDGAEQPWQPWKPKQR